MKNKLIFFNEQFCRNNAFLKALGIAINLYIRNFK
jgi:hypothetical protein